MSEKESIGVSAQIFWMESVNNTERENFIQKQKKTTPVARDKINKIAVYAHPYKNSVHRRDIHTEFCAFDYYVKKTIKSLIRKENQVYIHISYTLFTVMLVLGRFQERKKQKTTRKILFLQKRNKSSVKFKLK